MSENGYGAFFTTYRHAFYGGNAGWLCGCDGRRWRTFDHSCAVVIGCAAHRYPCHQQITSVCRVVFGKRYHDKKGVVRPKDIKAALIMAFVGSSVGTVLVQLSPPDMLKVVIPFLVAGVGLYTLFAPNLGQLESSPKVSQTTWQKTAVPLIGFYDGYLGPGTGTFFALSNVALRGMNLIQATGTAKLLNFATNIASLIFFIMGGQVLWTVGLVMMAGQAIGAFFGSHMVVKGGAKFIRPVIVLMCFAMLIKFIWAG